MFVITLHHVIYSFPSSPFLNFVFVLGDITLVSILQDMVKYMQNGCSILYLKINKSKKMDILLQRTQFPFSLSVSALCNIRCTQLNTGSICRPKNVPQLLIAKPQWQSNGERLYSIFPEKWQVSSTSQNRQNEIRHQKHHPGKSEKISLLPISIPIFPFPGYLRKERVPSFPKIVMSKHTRCCAREERSEMTPSM